MNRREFIPLIGGAAAAWPLLARAEQGDRTRRIVVLMAVAESDPDAAPRMAALAQRLQELGWTSGRNIRIDYRWPAPLTAGTGADFERMLSQELVQAKPDAILATGTPMVAALKRATTSVPIVFVQLADPVGSGLVAGLARPGGNITGFANYEYSISGKWLEVLKEAAPRLNKVLFMLNSTNAAWRGFQQSLEQVAASFKLQLTTADINDGADIERAIAAFAREPKGGLIVQPDQVTVVHRQFIAALAAEHRLPAVYPFRSFVTSGGLMSYGIDVPNIYRQAAGYIDRILRGEKAADLPVQQPTKFELVINLKAAKELGLDIAPTLLARADEVIE